MELVKTPLKRLSFVFLNVTAIALALSCSVKAQSNPQKLYVSILDVGPSVKTFFDNNDVKTVFTFNVGTVVSDDYQSIDTQKLENIIKIRIPNKYDRGIGSLDWEGKALNSLINLPSDNANFKSALNAFINLIKTAKTLRPNVKWGYYAVPFSRYYNRSKLSGDLSKIEPLLKECDIFFPSLYQSYKDGSIGRDDNEKFAYENLNTILPIAQRMGKPVLPFVWYRYHISNRNIGLQLIPSDEFEKYLNSILSVNYNGKKVSGLVCWSVDSYYLKMKAKPLLDEVSLTGGQDFGSYHDALVTKYTSGMLKLIKGKNE